jgi:hypothetical protein
MEQKEMIKNIVGVRDLPEVGRSTFAPAKYEMI